MQVIKQQAMFVAARPFYSESFHFLDVKSRDPTVVMGLQKPTKETKLQSIDVWAMASSRAVSGSPTNGEQSGFRVWVPQAPMFGAICTSGFAEWDWCRVHELFAVFTTPV